ncbi:CGNR zinc finger domain-containing protein [Pseudomonas sp. RTB3]|uniref:CGNR zinc finger domain-containing protein n=1 Tax=unclassified Pseudomonas TaxID=196821 RepID=UPI002B236401|nr:MULTISPECIES: CGNR zinc finger domain-containing protein [unclassified Pseudomonas]MEB0008391.1 CGNR zinc finger domain-containing protein [Pseudomonas sp. RTB2]MEB0018018.1 CGNR zinc finger domain-containing protein [Pseudomonas sp. RTB3]MEB0270184.1 CGNR zinc finger domain-containing protein [Pseudomonas sp. 5B4]
MFSYKWSKTAFVAGDRLLDFLNTVDFSGRAGNHNRLTSYSSVVEWSLAAAIIDSAEAQAISLIAANAPFQAKQALIDLVQWRETVYQVFSAVSQKHEPSPEEWRIIEVSIQYAISSASLKRNDIGIAHWVAVSNGLTTIPQRLALGLHELLASDLVAKIKQCEGCTWLFIDTSKNHRRRWCSMATCGNRAKAQRHYQVKATAE